MNSPLYSERSRQWPSGRLHPIRERHPWGEDRSFCSKCGEPCWTDDIAFATYHIGWDGSEMRPGCKNDG